MTRSRRASLRFRDGGNVRFLGRGQASAPRAAAPAGQGPHLPDTGVVLVDGSPASVSGVGRKYFAGVFRDDRCERGLCEPTHTSVHWCTMQ
jgi:hypothetical protein